MWPPLAVNEQAGANARASGLELADNPFTRAKAKPGAPADVDVLSMREEAWARGWVREDAVRGSEAQRRPA